MKLSFRERGLLVGLAVLVVGFGGRAWLNSGSSGDLGLGGGRAARRLAEDDPGMAVAELRVADLNRRTARMEVGRNPFRFAPLRTAKPPDPKPKRRRPAKRKPNRSAGSQPPRMTLHYVGRFGSKDLTIAVFSDGVAIFNAMQGDILDGKFIVDRIGLESADVKFVGFPDVPAVRLLTGG